MIKRTLKKAIVEIVALTLGFMFIVSFMVMGARGASFQCATEPAAKTESSISGDYDELYLEMGQIITQVYVKAGDQCISGRHGGCYALTAGGIGYNFVVVERVGDPGPDCQAISHIEVEYAQDPNTPTATETSIATTTEEGTPSPTPENTPTLTPTDENTPTSTSTDDPDTPTPTQNPTITPTPWSGTPTPWPTKPCTVDKCNGTG